ncbi:MAG: hypothetical protein V1725_02755 [archaeon]
MKKTTLLIIALLCLQVAYATCDREDWFCDASEYGLRWSNSAGTWDFFLWDPKGSSAGDPTKYDMNWYPLEQWEYDACTVDFSSDIHSSMASSDVSGESKVYDITIQATALRKNITQLSENLTFETMTSYEFEWYVQPPYGDQAYQVVLKSGSTETVLKEDTANYITGSAGYHQEYTINQYDRLLIKYNDQEFNIPVRWTQ